MNAVSGVEPSVLWCCVQVKSVKPCLKQLQQCIQTISTLHDDEILPSNSADLFHWLPKEHMCVLVYLVSDFSDSENLDICFILRWFDGCVWLFQVTVMHSMQAGYLEKAQKYTDKALMQLEKLKSESGHMIEHTQTLWDADVCVCDDWCFCVFASAGLQPHPVVISSHSAGAHHHVSSGDGTQGHGAAGGGCTRSTLQHVAPDDCVLCNTCVRVCWQISQVCQLCQQSPRLFSNHAAQLHTLLVSQTPLTVLRHTFMWRIRAARFGKIAFVI